MKEDLACLKRRKAFIAYMKTEEGYNTIARYASKGDVIAGNTFISDGKLSEHTLQVKDISLSEQHGQIIPEKDNASITLNKNVEGVSVLRIYSLGRTKADVTESMAHELNLHGAKHENNMAGKNIPTVD